MSEEALVDRKQAFCLDRLEQTVEHALVKVTSLVVHSRHDRIWMIKVSRTALHGVWEPVYVPGGCITQQTTTPDTALLAKCRPGPSSIPTCFIKRRFAKK